MVMFLLKNKNMEGRMLNRAKRKRNNTICSLSKWEKEDFDTEGGPQPPRKKKKKTLEQHHCFQWQWMITATICHLLSSCLKTKLRGKCISNTKNEILEVFFLCFSSSIFSFVLTFFFFSLLYSDNIFFLSLLCFTFVDKQRYWWMTNVGKWCCYSLYNICLDGCLINFGNHHSEAKTVLCNANGSRACPTRLDDGWKFNVILHIWNLRMTFSLGKESCWL